MSQTLQHQDGIVTLTPLEEGRLHIKVQMADEGAFVRWEEWETSYSAELVAEVLKAKGPAWFCDELKRDEDPGYVENDIRHDVLGFVDPEEFTGKRVLDFGCGCGASTVVISRVLPGAEITGIELDAQSLAIAKMRLDHHGIESTRLLLSPDPESLPSGIGDFDFILFSAVFEHLLPEERTRLLPKIWAQLRPGGILFLNQTPHRYFPIEGHTTGLPLINYMPAPMALWATNQFCSRFPRETDWPSLLRNGIRGGTPREVLDILRSTGEMPCDLVPSKNGLRDHLDLWDRSSSVRHDGVGHRVKVAAIKTVRLLTGRTVVPNISMGIMKEKP